MNLLRNRYRSWIVPYVDGALDARRQAKLEALLARDPALAAEADAQRCTVKRLHETAAARDAAEEPTGARLWPAIEARLTPCRRSTMPLFLAGGLCAAAASLAWAAFWGPLRHWGDPVKTPAAVATNSGVDISSAPIVGGESRHHHKRLRYRPHHSNPLAKRPDSLQTTPKPDSDDRQDDQEQPGDHLADNSTSPSSDGPDGNAAPTPKLAVGVKPHFRLAPLVHSFGPNDAQGNGSDAPSQSSGDSAPIKDGEQTSDGAAGSPDAATAETDQPAANHSAVTPRSHRRYRHRHRSREAAASAKTPDQKTPAGAAPSETKPTDSAAPKHPTIKPGLID